MHALTDQICWEFWRIMYQLHSCIKIWIIPKASFGTSNDFVCEFCTKTFGVGEWMENHICCLHVSVTWTIPKRALKNHIYCNHAKIFELFPKASFGISNDFVCEFCTKTFGFGERMKNHICCLHVPETWTILKGALKNHIYCNHAKYFELFPKASFGASNDFVCEFCISTFAFVERIKNHTYCLHASETWIYPKASFGTSIVSNATYALKSSILWMLRRIISMAIMQLSCLATSNDFRPKKSQGAPCMNMNLFRLMLNSLTYGFGLIHTLPRHLYFKNAKP